MRKISVILYLLLFYTALFAQDDLCSSIIDKNDTSRECQQSGGYNYSSFYSILKQTLKEGKSIYEIEKTYIDDAPANNDIKYYFRVQNSTNSVYLVLDEYHTEPYLVFAYANNDKLLINKEECSTPMILNRLNPKEIMLTFSCADTDYTIYQRYGSTKIQSISLQIKKGDKIELLRGELSSLLGDLRSIENAIEGDVLKNITIKGAH